MKLAVRLILSASLMALAPAPLLSAQAPARLEPGDCDLLRDLSEQVFPKLDIRPATRIGCYASATRVKPDMDVDALVRVAAPRAAAETLPPS